MPRVRKYHKGGNIIPHDHPHGVVKREMWIPDENGEYKIKPTDFWPIVSPEEALEFLGPEWKRNTNPLFLPKITSKDSTAVINSSIQGKKKLTQGLWAKGNRRVSSKIKPLESLLKTIEQDPIDKELQASTSIPTSRRNTELMYKLNANMRTGQEPDKYKVWDEKGKKWSMRDVEPEELEYYRNKNKIQDRQRIQQDFKDGGSVKEPEGVEDLLAMLNAHGTPKDQGALSSLVSDSTQPSGYTPPVLPEEKKIELIDKPAQITQAPDEVKKADWSTMFANPMQMLKYTGKYGMTRPTKAELDAQKSNIYDSITSMFNPSSYVEALKHMDTSLDSADQALLQGFKDGRLSPGDLSNVVGNLSDAGMQALFLSMAPMGGRTWASAIKELRRPALGARIPQEFRGSRLLGPTAETATTESSALQQLAGKKPKVKKKKYEPVNEYQDSNVAHHSSTNYPGVYQYPSFMTGSKLEKQVSPKDGTIARSVLEQLVKNKNTKASEALAVEKILGGFDDKRVPYEYFKQELALGIQPAEIIGSTGRSSYANNGLSRLGYNVNPELIKKQNEIDRLTFIINNPDQLVGRHDPSQTIDQITLNIKNQIKKLKEKLGPDLIVNPKTNLYKDKSLGLTKEGESHFPRDPHSFWIRSFASENSLRVLEWQTDVKKLKIPSKGIPGSKAAAEGLPLKFLNESLLDAARQGKKYLDVPTLETIYKIEGYQTPNQEQLEASEHNVKIIIDKYNSFIPGEGYSTVGFIDDGVNELKKNYDKLRDQISEAPKALGTEQRSSPYRYSKFFHYIQLSHPGAPLERIKTIEAQWLALQDFQTYVARNYIPTDEYASSQFFRFGVKPTVNALKRHIPDMKKSFLKNLNDAEQLTIKNAEVAKTKLKENQEIVERIQSGGIKVSDMNEGRLSTTRDYRNFPKLWSKEFGTEVINFKDEFGNTYNRVVVPEKFFQTDPFKPLEIKTYKKGGLLNKLVKKYQDGGGIFKKLRQRRADRRIAKTPVRDATGSEVLEMLSSYGADSPMMRGEYNPREKEIIMYKDDPDALKHEQVHAAQYGPLQRLAKRMNDERSAAIQDPTKRKVYRKLSENISPEAYADFNIAGKLILDRGEEFEAVLDTGVNAAKEKGVNFNASFEEILSQLKNIPSPTNNMRGLMKFMSNKFTKEQRDLILKSIR